MDTTKLIKQLVAIEFLLAVIYLILSFALEPLLPIKLQEFLIAEANSEWTTADTIDLFFGIPLLVAVVASLIGILRTKLWGKYLYLGTAVFGFLLTPTVGPTVDHAYSAAIYHLSSLAAGGAIALLLFTQSSFNRPVLERA